MKNIKTLLLMSIVISSLLLSSCGNKNNSDEEKSAKRDEKMVEILLKEEGASEKERAEVRCMMELTKKIGPLKTKLTKEHKLALSDQFDRLNESFDECENTLELLGKIQEDINLSSVAVVRLPFGTYDLPDVNSVQHQAEVSGHLVLENACLYLVSGVQKYAPIFPAQDTHWSPTKKELTILGHSFSIGTTLKTNGGYISNIESLEGLLINSVPEACATDEIVMVGTQAWNK